MGSESRVEIGGWRNRIGPSPKVYKFLCLTQLRVLSTHPVHYFLEHFGIVIGVSQSLKCFKVAFAIESKLKANGVRMFPRPVPTSNSPKNPQPPSRPGGSETSLEFRGSVDFFSEISFTNVVPCFLIPRGTRCASNRALYAGRKRNVAHVRLKDVRTPGWLARARKFRRGVPFSRSPLKKSETPYYRAARLFARAAAESPCDDSEARRAAFGAAIPNERYGSRPPWLSAERPLAAEDHAWALREISDKKRSVSPICCSRTRVPSYITDRSGGPPRRIGSQKAPRVRGLVGVN